MTMIEADGLSKIYNGSYAIDRVSFQIQEGEIVGLLGLNGAGKSTILKMLGCFLLPSGGSAKVAGFAVDQDPHEIRKLIGYLPDTPPLYDEMTVVDYLRFVARLKDVEDSRLNQAVSQAIEKTNLQDVLRYRLSELSHGFRQRVGIAQALVHDPKVLILDEPINGLDPVQIVEMRDLILSLRGRHTVVLSSHILSEITKTCDRILVIDRGRLVAEGSETALEKKLAKNMRILCDIDRAVSDPAKLFEGMSGVTAVRSVALGQDNNTGRIVIETEGDARAAIASHIVKAGIGLLGMTREDAGLEGLFMKLVKGNEKASSKRV